MVLWHSRRITLRSWRMKAGVSPRSCTSRSGRFSTCARPGPSSPDAISSARMKSGSGAMARAMPTRWRLPPGNSCGWREAKCPARLHPGRRDPAPASPYRRLPCRSPCRKGLAPPCPPDRGTWPRPRYLAQSPHASPMPPEARRHRVFKGFLKPDTGRGQQEPRQIKRSGRRLPLKHLNMKYANACNYTPEPGRPKSCGTFAPNRIARPCQVFASRAETAPRLDGVSARSVYTPAHGPS